MKFTSPLSALRVCYSFVDLGNVLMIQAVNALEGRIFNGNTISALFYETELFETGVYEPENE